MELLQWMNAGSSPDGSGGLVAEFTVVALLVEVVAVDAVVKVVVIVEAVVIVAVVKVVEAVVVVIDVVVAVAAKGSTSYFMLLEI